MKNKLEQLKTEILERLNEVRDPAFLRELEVKYLGRKGELTQILRSIADLAVEEKKDIGFLANEIKKEVQDRFQDIRKIIESDGKTDLCVDVTLPGKKLEYGHLSPISIVQYELEDMFSSMGFTVVDGPEIEGDYYNFEALNIPAHHPARDMQDTFYVDIQNKKGEYDLLLRTHTSTMQIRAMEKYGAPLRIVAPGRVFRCEATDARHEHTFYQFECMMIDKGINISHMKAMIEDMLRFLYGDNTQIRMRPKFYPFVEPGVNIEATCFLCHGKGCRVCKQTGWLEIGGAGMVHPSVLKAGNIDPKEYSGFAFGFGTNRLAMLKYGIEDGRLFMGGDLRFAEQF